MIRGLRILATVLLVALTAWSLVALAGIGGFVDDDDVPGQSVDESIIGLHLSQGVGDSMSPTIEDGDRALCAEWVDPQEGDIVAVDAEAAGTEVDMRHRIVEIDRDEDRVVTRGDGNDHDDAPVSLDDIRCVVVWHRGDNQQQHSAIAW